MLKILGKLTVSLIWLLRAADGWLNLNLKALNKAQYCTVLSWLLIHFLYSVNKKLKYAGNNPFHSTGSDKISF